MNGVSDNLMRNIGALTQAEQCLLQSKKIFICGCGGLGGFTAEFSARLTFKKTFNVITHTTYNQGIYLI